MLKPTLPILRPADLNIREPRQGGKAYRRVHCKVKTGCTRCKIRHQKCDERRPVCSGCTRYSTRCIYEARSSPHQESGIVPVTMQTTQLRRRESLQRSLPRSPSSDLNLEDLELLHQYLTVTSIATAQLPEMTLRAQVLVPQLAQRHHFVMYGLLAMAATHLSRVRLERQEHYLTVAARKQKSGIPPFRSALQNISEDNHEALIAFAKSLVWCSFATGKSTLDVVTSSTQMSGNWLPSWFKLLRGSCFIVESSRRWINDGPYALIDLDDTADFTDHPDDTHLSQLMVKLIPMAESPLCEVVLCHLREAFTRSYMREHNTPMRNALNFWVGRLPNRYMDMVQRKEPWALVILAYFCVLVDRSETVWFMKGHAAELLRRIVTSIDEKYQSLIQWPCREIRLEQILIGAEEATRVCAQ